MAYSDLLKDPRWQRKRLEVLERDKWTCQYCRDTEETLHVHHTHYAKGDPWDVPSGFLTTLCSTCHEAEERLKAYDIAGHAMADLGITRKHILLLVEHTRYKIETSEEGSSVEAFYRVLDSIITDEDDRSKYVQWLTKRRGK